MADMEKAIEEVEALVTTYADNTQYDAFRLILSTNREMREATERLMDAEFAKDWRTWSDERARLLLGVGPRFDAFMEARSALTTQRGDGE